MQHEVTITHLGFDPPELTVKCGDVVRWLNKDSVQHTATADEVDEAQAAFASQPMRYGASFNWQAAEPAVITYHCNFHPQMVGMLTVE